MPQGWKIDMTERAARFVQACPPREVDALEMLRVRRAAPAAWREAGFRPDSTRRAPFGRWSCKAPVLHPTSPFSPRL